MREEYSLQIVRSLKVLNKQWLPIPFLRFAEPYTYAQGPSNWARMRVVELSEPDIAGNNYRLTLAFDTRLMKDNKHVSYMQPTDEDIGSNSAYKLCTDVTQSDWFYNQEWVKSWLEEVYKEGSRSRNGRALDPDELQRALNRFEPQAHMLNVLGLISLTTVHAHHKPQPLFTLPIVRIKSGLCTPELPAIGVDLVLDVGNSRTCGILIENSREDSARLHSNYILQLRDFSNPECVYNDPFDSRIEFAKASFGKEHFSKKSGRSSAFEWPSLVRIGTEASNLASVRNGTNGFTGLSSPKRYLWDEKPVSYTWRFNSTHTQDVTELWASAEPFRRKINGSGEALFTLEEDDRHPVITPCYSRSSIMTFMLAEVLAQAICQMNSPAQRTRQGLTDTPRQLNSITLTVPPGMTQEERTILDLRLKQAIGLVWKSLGWHAGEEPPPVFDKNYASRSPAPTVKLPAIHVEWDEASCGQLVYLFTEVHEHFAGHPEQFFKAIARPDKQNNEGEEKITLATIDIGGGTTDLVVTQYSLDHGGEESGGSHAYIKPQQLFNDSFKVAGDNIMLAVIRQMILPYFQEALARAGVQNPEQLLPLLCGSENKDQSGLSISAQQKIYRQQLNLQVFVPIALSILKKYEQYDIEQQSVIEASTFKILMDGSVASEGVQTFVRDVLKRNHCQNADTFDLHDIAISIDLYSLHASFLTGENIITHSLGALCEVIRQYPCDVLLLTGRPSRLPGVQAFIRQSMPLHPGRIVPMHDYRTGSWYPFHRSGRIADPKTTAAVGAMLCMLSENRSTMNFHFLPNGLQPNLAIRYFGVIDGYNHITNDFVIYEDIKNDDEGLMQLPTEDGTPDGAPKYFAVRGPTRLGFRQLPLERWAAAPLYILKFTDSGKEKLHSISKDTGSMPVVKVSLEVAENRKNQDSTIEGMKRYSLAIAEVECDEGSFNKRDLSIEFNTMLDTEMSETTYWLDSGSVQ